MDCFIIDDSLLVTIVINPSYHFEYLCFKKGRYSWFTEEAKEEILDYLFEHVSKKSHKLLEQVRSVFMRDQMLKKYYEKTLNVTLTDDMELGDRMNEEEETFKSYEHGSFKKIGEDLKKHA